MPSPAGSIRPFLRAADSQIDPPLVHAEIDARQGADSVHEQQRRMLRLIQSPAHSGDVAGDPGGSLVMAGEHTLDLVSLVGPEYLLVTVQRHALAPFDIENLHLIAETLRHIDQRWLNWPKRAARILSPGERVLVSAASHAPVPRMEK